MMTACKQAATNHLVVMAVSAAVVMSLTVAMPFQETSEAGIAANINQVQKKLKFSMNAFSLITRPSCEVVLQLDKPCRLWDDVPTNLQLSGENITNTTAIHIRNSICKQISQTTEFIQGDRNCTESVVEYLCSRHKSQRESYFLYGNINTTISQEEYVEWARQTFTAPIADIIISY